MPKTLLLSISFMMYSVFSYSQNISIHTPKLNYKLKDTIPLRILNTNQTDVYYAIGLEAKNESKWEELEPTLNQEGKAELWGKLKKSQSKIIKVVLPRPLKVCVGAKWSDFYSVSLKKQSEY